MKTTAISIVVAAILIGGAVMFSGGSKDVNNVTTIDGKQIITINAKGGYSPNVTTAKAEMPTVIKVKTRGTFDCSSALTIPKLGYNKTLPPSGETEIEVSPQIAGTTIQGLCAMGMYGFKINFD